MADGTETVNAGEPEASAEVSFAAAAAEVDTTVPAEPVATLEAVEVVATAEPVLAEVAEPVVVAEAAPAKAKRGRKPGAAKVAKPAPVAEPVILAPAGKAAPKVKAAPVAKVKPVRKAKVVAPKLATVADTKKKTNISQLKETIMATKKNPDLTAGIKSVITDVQGKAKAGYAKGAAVLGEAGQFTKGNVDAVVESGKILAAGIKEFGEGYAAEAKAAYATLTTDAKELAAAKTPVDFFKLQGELARRNFDQAIAFGSKSSEAFLKLAGEAIVPLQGRVSLAVSKIKKAA